MVSSLKVCHAAEKEQAGADRQGSKQNVQRTHGNLITEPNSPDHVDAHANLQASQGCCHAC